MLKKSVEIQRSEASPQEIAGHLKTEIVSDKATRNLSDTNKLIILRLQQVCEEIREELQLTLKTLHEPFDSKYPTPERTLEILTEETPKVAAERSLREAKTEIKQKKSHPMRIYTVEEEQRNRFLISAKDIIEGAFDNIVVAEILDSRPDDNETYKNLRHQKLETMQDQLEPAMITVLQFRAKLKEKIQQMLEEIPRERRRMRKPQPTPPSPHL